MLYDQVGTYPSDDLEALYPDIYHAINPYLNSMVAQMNANPDMEITSEIIDNITNSIMDNLGLDDNSWANMAANMSNDAAPAMAQIYPYSDAFRQDPRRGNRFFTRDLLRILFLNEFRRRRRHRHELFEPFDQGMY